MTIDWFGHRKGVRWDRDDRGREIARQVLAVGRDDGDGPGHVGLMLHHAVTDPESLADVEALLGLLSGHPAVEPTTLLARAAASVRVPDHPI